MITSMNAYLSDFFPYKLKSEFTKNYIKIGQVFKVYSDVAKKTKYAIVVGISGDKISLATTLINSKINPNVNNTEDKINNHHLLSFSKYNFLTHDSFVDCNNLILLSMNKLTDDSFMQENNKGELTDEDLEHILLKITKNPQIPISVKKKYNIVKTA